MLTFLLSIPIWAVLLIITIVGFAILKIKEIRNEKKNGKWIGHSSFMLPNMEGTFESVAWTILCLIAWLIYFIII